MRSRRQPPEISARVKVWLEAKGDYVFGLGIGNILKAVAQEGSIKGAAAAVGLMALMPTIPKRSPSNIRIARLILLV